MSKIKPKTAEIIKTNIANKYGGAVATIDRCVTFEIFNEAPVIDRKLFYRARG